MKLLYDFFPVLLFFIAYKAADIYVATGVAIAATIVQVGTSWLKRRRVEPMHLVTLGLLVVFGGATLLLHDEIFVKWKPTVINWLFGLVFLASQWVGGRPLTERLMAKNVELPTAAWRQLNIAWALFFLVIGVINLYVVYNFDTDTWVNFKLFGIIGLTLFFVFIQSIFIARYIRDAQIHEDNDG